MPVPVCDFYDYETSTQLYARFLPANLLAQIRPLLPLATATDAQILGAINRVVQPIPFGMLAHVGHESLKNAAVATDTLLQGYRLGVPQVVGQPARPRAVITAGVHARELAPPLAVARYFSQLIVHYVQGQLSPSLQLPLEHPGFFYQAGPHHVMKDNGDPVRPNYADDKDKPQRKVQDETLSPDPNQGIFIKSHLFSYNDIADIIQDLEIIVLPTANPTGLDFVLTQVPEDPEDTEERKNWRKTRVLIDPNDVNTAHPVLSPPAIGVDIARNADFAWNYERYYTPAAAAKNSGTFDPDDAQNYIGFRANSEPETCAIIAALLSDLQLVTGTDGAQRTAMQEDWQAHLPAPRPSGTTGHTGPRFTDGRPWTPRYTGHLFYLDVHSYSQAIFIPWGTDTITPVGPEPNQNPPVDSKSAAIFQIHSSQNPFFDQTPADDAYTYKPNPRYDPDHPDDNPEFLNTRTNELNENKRDGVYKLAKKYKQYLGMPFENYAAGLRPSGATHDGGVTKNMVLTVNDRYQEFFPPYLSFSRAPGRTYELVKDHLFYFARPMAQAITHAVSGRAQGGTENMRRMARRCDYAVQQSTALYTLTGNPCDYVFNLNMLKADLQDDLLMPSMSGEFVNTRRTGPIVSLAIEVGHVDDGAFYPRDDVQRQRRGDYHGSQYLKVERETFAALHHFLLSSRSYSRGATAPNPLLDGNPPE